MMFIQGNRGRLRVSVYNDDIDEENNAPDNNIGLAFSGGGIRSAAFSSGILRRLLQKQIQVDYISCISGGNFTAAAYLDWKYRHGQTDSHKWHHEFFENMRSRAGYLCDWSRLYSGLLDTIAILLALLFVNIIIPVIVWGGLAIPTAYLVDFIFGDVLRTGFNCTTPIAQMYPFPNTTRCSSTYHRHYPGVQNQLVLFVTLLLAFLFLFVLKSIFKKYSQAIAFIQLLSGTLFGMVFLPWFLQQFFDSIPTWLSTLILCLSLFFWCGFPPLREFASVAVVFYVFAFIIKWRVYRSPSMLIDYREEYFYTALLVAGGVLWASPYLGAFGRSAIYTFVKWRFQYAFFTEESVGKFGCGGITCADFFPILSTICDCSKCCTKKRALTMADIADMKPQYISNIVAAYWRRNTKTLPDTMIGLCSKKIEIITEDPGSDKLNSTLSPRHVKLADAMSTAAMVTKPTADLEDKYEPFRELQLILGLTATNETTAYPPASTTNNTAVSKFAPIILQSIAGAPIIFLAVLWLADINVNPLVIEAIVMLVFICYVLVFAAVAMMPTGASKPWRGEPIVRWCHVHLYHVRFLREFLNISNVGPLPPAVMSLSDLGRLEKYGLLTLFKRRLKKIVVADGSLMANDESYATHLLRSLQMARELYHCEFTGYDGRDVIGEIHKMYLKHPSGKLPRTYRFVVNYFDRIATGFQKAGEGEVLILAPRHPTDGFTLPGKDCTWKEFTDDTGIQLDPNHWGTGPVLKSDEVERLTFCCCEMCHTNVGCCQSVSKKLFMGFPRHSTVNQFFTPQMFSAYHREGYRACIEGDIEGFLTNNIV